MSPERVLPNSEEDKELLAQHVARYMFASQFVRGKSVLDIACGNGYGSEILLAGQPSRIIGVDISLEAIEFARNQSPDQRVEFRVGDAEQIADLGRFDIVTSFETIEHLQHPERFLEKLHNILGKDGQLVISTPLRTAGTLQTKPSNPFHVREWIEEEFINFLSDYFRRRERYYQFVLKKRPFPGSRTITKFISKVIAPKENETFAKFSVVNEPPPFHAGVLVKGYIIVVCKV